MLLCYLVFAIVWLRIINYLIFVSGFTGVDFDGSESLLPEESEELELGVLLLH